MAREHLSLARLLRISLSKKAIAHKQFVGQSNHLENIGNEKSVRDWVLKRTDFVAAHNNLVILATSTAGVYRNQVLSRRQTGVVDKLNPSMVGMHCSAISCRPNRPETLISA